MKHVVPAPSEPRPAFGLDSVHCSCAVGLPGAMVTFTSTLPLIDPLPVLVHAVPVERSQPCIVVEALLLPSAPSWPISVPPSSKSWLFPGPKTLESDIVFVCVPENGGQGLIPVFDPVKVSCSVATTMR